MEKLRIFRRVLCGTEDWQLENPAGKPIGIVRRIRDQVKTKVKGLMKELNI
jgi:hypothetical protein